MWLVVLPHKTGTTERKLVSQKEFEFISPLKSSNFLFKTLEREREIMASFSFNASVVALMAIIFASFIFIGEAQIADAPAPSPASGSSSISPSFAAFFISFAVLLFGSLFR
ncbi:hypothetical protein AQUCO_00100179v1 [Aquilegia coerulea]|uniref:Uncharacterized protein n=1 Tax=Aquilegia coerulea TaxID=218851 RepID=A0A2G5F946_AQUCA|nr:hypothetical protein AQUCO_00100179v1 [Aquilegia coerulea]